MLQFTAKSDVRPWGHELHFLIQVPLAFLFVAGVMTAVTVIKPLAAVKVLPVPRKCRLNGSRRADRGGLRDPRRPRFVILFW